jgi:peptidoglycan/LPS O-acetylase OafA/YrhL
MGISWKKPSGNFGRLAARLLPVNREIDLDVVRGVAILLAMGWHLNLKTGNPIFDALEAPGLRFGWAGVDLFFVLSGFLVGRLVFREEVKTGTFDYPRFFVRRALKLWPVLYVYLVVAIALSGEPFMSFAPQIGLHVQNYLVPSQAHHLWSLAVEEHFYLAVGLLLPMAMRKMKTGAIASVLLSLIIAALMARYAGAALGATPNDLQMQTQYRVDGLSAGVLLALVYVRCPDMFARVVKWKLAWLAVTVAGIVWLSVVSKGSWLGSTLGFSVSWITGLGFLLLTYRSGIDRWARWPSLALAFLGAYSYSLYIWHVAVAKIANGKLASLPLPLKVLAAYGAAIAVAVVMTLIIERPILAVRDRWIASKG